MSHFPAVDWDALPKPEDDGAADHLDGLRLPSVPLPATDGRIVDLGAPDAAPPKAWDEIPVARGCTPQSCAFRDRFAELQGLGVDHLFGLSTQDSAYRGETRQRLRLPFLLLSDEHLEIATTLDLPTFEAGGGTFPRRLTLVIENGRVVKVFFPVFPPDRNAADVMAWLSARAR